MSTEVNIGSVDIINVILCPSCMGRKQQLVLLGIRLLGRITAWANNTQHRLARRNGFKVVSRLELKP